MFTPQLPTAATTEALHCPATQYHKCHSIKSCIGSDVACGTDFSVTCVIISLKPLFFISVTAVTSVFVITVRLPGNRWRLQEVIVNRQETVRQITSLSAVFVQN